MAYKPARAPASPRGGRRVALRAPPPAALRPTLGWGGGALSPRATAKPSQTGALGYAGAAGPPRT